MLIIDNVSSEMRTRRYLISCCVVIFTGLITLYFAVFKGLWQAWMSEEQYSYAVFVPVIFAYFIWTSWPSLSRLKPVSSLYGLCFILSGYLLFLFGAFGLHGFSARFSFMLMLSGFTLYLLGSGFLRRLAFPFFILLFMIPLPEALDTFFLFKLRLLSSAASTSMLRLFGISVFRQGNLIDIGDMQFNIVDACSGMNYVLPMMLLTAIMGSMLLKRYKSRAILFLLSIPISFLINVVRITGTALLSHYWSPQIAKGFLHAFSGWAVFMFGLCLVYIAYLILRRCFEKDAVLSAPTEQPAANADSSSRELHPPGMKPLLVSASLLCIFILGYHAIVAKKGNAPIPQLSALPSEIAGYAGTALPEDPGIKEFSSVTDSLARIYQKEGVSPIVLYLGYYRTTPDLKGFFHTPAVCLASSGWEVKRIAPYDLPAVGGNGPIHASLVFSEKPNQKQILLYWYQIGALTTGRERLAHFYTAYDSIFGRYDDAVKLMISMEYNSPDEVNSCIEQLKAFTTAFLVPFNGMVGRKSGNRLTSEKVSPTGGQATVVMRAVSHE